MKKILLQLDTDAHASSFDAITAIDAGADCLLPFHQVNTSNVVPLVQGAIFTRSPKELRHTAIFIGGSDVEAAEAVFRQVSDCFFGPMRVSVMMDANGCNTTSAAAVCHIALHVPLRQVRAVVLGGTGPVGRRVAEILSGQGSEVTVASRSLARASKVCSQFKSPTTAQAAELPSDGDFSRLLEGKNVVIAAGAAGVEFTSLEQLQQFPDLKLAIDLNAVPPLGITGIESTDKARQVGSLLCYGAVGIGGLKMKIHHTLIDRLFRNNEQIFGTMQIYDVAEQLL